jgi:hypothetical protein
MLARPEAAVRVAILLAWSGPSSSGPDRALGMRETGPRLFL